MTTYHKLFNETTSAGVEVLEYAFTDQLRGLYRDNVIAVHADAGEVEKLCILAEELGHHHTGTGNAIDPQDPNARREEKRARRWAHKKLIPLPDLLAATIRCEGTERWELAEYLGVTDEFLCEALTAYKEAYGPFIEVGDYCLYFEPLTVAHYTF